MSSPSNLKLDQFSGSSTADTSARKRKISLRPQRVLKAVRGPQNTNPDFSRSWGFVELSTRTATNTDSKSSQQQSRSRRINEKWRGVSVSVKSSFSSLRQTSAVPSSSLRRSGNTSTLKTSNTQSTSSQTPPARISSRKKHIKKEEQHIYGKGDETDVTNTTEPTATETTLETTITETTTPSKLKSKKKGRKSGTGSRSSKGTKGSEGKQKKKKHSKEGGKGKKGKNKPIKLNRKAIYKEMKHIEKKSDNEAKMQKKFTWEKNKLVFYWNCVVEKQLDLSRRNAQLKKKQTSMKLEKKHGMFHEYWEQMNCARNKREEFLRQKKIEFHSMVAQLRDAQKKQTDKLFRDIQTYVNDTYLVGQKQLDNIVGLRMNYTKKMTQTLFDARDNLGTIQTEQNGKYGPVLEEFEAEMRQMRGRVPKERQERLREMLAWSQAMLVELVSVYSSILHHNFIEVCRTADIINELKTRERRLQREMDELNKKRNRIKERTVYLHDRVSNLKRQVNAGNEVRKRLQKVMRDQEVWLRKRDVGYINKELMYQENADLKKTVDEMSEKVDDWYFKVKRHFLKNIIIQAGKYKERALQLKNYNRLVKRLFEVEDGFLEAVETFKDHEEFEDVGEGLKVLIGSFRPYTMEELEKDFEGCSESFTTSIIFFKRRLRQNFLTLDDLHFFIKRRSPLSYLTKEQYEEDLLSRRIQYCRLAQYGGFLSTNQIAIPSFRL